MAEQIRLETVMTIQNLLLTEIVTDNELNVSRESISPASVHELASDIRTHGLQQPVSVRPLSAKEQEDNPGKKYALIMGFRRAKACRALGWETIPATIQTVSPEKAEELNMIENLHRQNLTFWEEALFVKRYYDKGYGRTAIATAVSKPLGWVQRRMQVWQLPQKAQDLIKAGVLTQAIIAKLNSYEDMEELNNVIETMHKKYQNSSTEDAVFRIPTAQKTKKDRSNRKLIRTKPEILNLMKYMREELSVPQGVWYRIAAWATGEITDNELLADLKEFMLEIYDEEVEVPKNGIPDME